MRVCEEEVGREGGREQVGEAGVEVGGGGEVVEHDGGAEEGGAGGVALGALHPRAELVELGEARHPEQRVVAEADVEDLWRWRVILVGNKN